MKKCRCQIRAVVQMWRMKKGISFMIHPDDYEKTLRAFKYCPLCGNELKE